MSRGSSARFPIDRVSTTRSSTRLSVIVPPSCWMRAASSRAFLVLVGEGGGSGLSCDCLAWGWCWGGGRGWGGRRGCFISLPLWRGGALVPRAGSAAAALSVALRAPLRARGRSPMLLGCAAPACDEVRGDITVCEVNRDKVRVRRDVSCPVRNALHEDDPHALPLDFALQLQHSKIRAHARLWHAL